MIMLLIFKTQIVAIRHNVKYFTSKSLSMEVSSADKHANLFPILDTACTMIANEYRPA